MGFEDDDADNVDTYLERYVNNGDVAFDYRLMSKVLHPKDWDPRRILMTPLDMDVDRRASRSRRIGNIPRPIWMRGKTASAGGGGRI